jgi:hypothetical protein
MSGDDREEKTIQQQNYGENPTSTADETETVMLPFRLNAATRAERIAEGKRFCEYKNIVRFVADVTYHVDITEKILSKGKEYKNNFTNHKKVVFLAKGNSSIDKLKNIASRQIKRFSSSIYSRVDKSDPDYHYYSIITNVITSNMVVERIVGGVVDWRNTTRDSDDE